MGLASLLFRPWDGPVDKGERAPPAATGIRRNCISGVAPHMFRRSYFYPTNARMGTLSIMVSER